MITGTFSAEDYIAAQRLHRQKAVRWYHGIGAITTLLGAAWLYSTRELESLILLGAGIGALLGESAVAFIYLPWNARRMHRQQRDFTSPFPYTWNAETIEA